MPGTPLRGLVVDLDDTLVPWQTPLHWQWAWRPRGPIVPERHVRAVVRRQLHRWDRERWLGRVGRGPVPDVESYRRFLSETLADIAGYPLPEAEATAVVERFLRPAHEAERFPEVAAVLDELARRDLPVAVVTELPRESARSALRRAGLAESLLVGAGDDEGARVPSAEAFRAAASRIERKPRELLYVGDLYWSDVRAAVRAGLVGVTIDRSRSAGRAHGARIASIIEVPGLIEHPPTDEPDAASADEEPVP